MDLTDLLAHAPARTKLVSRPTPVERAPWLDVGAARTWVKRDDLTSDVYGGGKARKLEWILANPPYDAPRPVVSVGGIGSHHLVALALFLRMNERRLHALTFDQTPTSHVVRNLAVLASVGTRFWSVKTRARLPWAWTRYRFTAPPDVRGVWMEPGASTPLGCLGFVEAGFELAAQIERHELPSPNTIFVTAGTAGTAAGLLLGLAWAGVPSHLRLVSSVERWAFNEVMLWRKVVGVHRLLRRHGARHLARDVGTLLRRARVTYSIDHAEVGGGYGVPTGRCLEAVELASARGLRLEATYTGKCLAALRRSAVRGHILFWNTHASNDLAPRIEANWQNALPERLRALLATESRGVAPHGAISHARSEA